MPARNRGSIPEPTDPRRPSQVAEAVAYVDEAEHAFSPDMPLAWAPDEMREALADEMAAAVAKYGEDA